METIKIKYFDKSMDKLQHNGEWIDLRVRDVELCGVIGSVTEETAAVMNGKCITRFYIKAGSTVLVKHGIAMKLPFGKEGLTRPRSSLFKKYGLLYATSGVIDSAYCGPDDEWMTVMYATRDCVIEKNERVCQFRTLEKMPLVKFELNDLSENSNRGGHGSTGRM